MLLTPLQERKVAVDSLRSVARLLTEAYQPLHDVVHGRSDIPENHSLDTFFSAVKATADVSPAFLCPCALCCAERWCCSCRA